MRHWAQLALFTTLVAGPIAGIACGTADPETGATNDPGNGGGDAGESSSGGMGGDGGDAAAPECVDDGECGAGTICVDGSCVVGCSEDSPCADGGACCNGGCFDLETDIDHCGSCDSPCAPAPNMEVTCSALMCNYGACADGFFNCDGDTSNGCESNVPCSCTPGDTQPCYPGPPGTEANGVCQTGYQECNDAGTAWSLCYDFVIPSAEICGSNVDEDCTGTADDVVDVDGDGWTRCDNDCCETATDCSTPDKVNPGAFEALNNMVDDDCDPGTSDTVAAAACSTADKLTGVTPADLAGAIDLCQLTTASPPLAQRSWGVISASYRHADGSTPNATRLGQMQDRQAAVMTQYGNSITPQQNGTMMGISTGHMRSPGQADYVVPGGFLSGGVNFGHTSSPPAGYLAANGGTLPASQGCNGNCAAGAGANDSVNLRLEVRVPTNALSFKYQFRYFTGEYRHWTCSVYNDFYLALLTSGAMGLPADGNISFDALTNPVSVNNGFFDVCPAQGCYTCPSGTTPLVGTGMDAGGYGGGTDWLQTTAPIVPGETMTLELMVFDVSDNVLDSLVIIDAFEWSLSASSVGTGPPG